MRSLECYLHPASGELLEVSLPLTLTQEALITGTVLDETSTPLGDVLVLLLSQDTGELISYAKTDPQGRFWIGPVPGDALYTLRAQSPALSLRTVELSV